MSKKTAIIIGAGPAGLTAAYKLLKETDIKPIVLESSEYIGGISRTAVYHGNRMDIGGHRFFSKDDEVMQFWEELMPIQGKDARDDKLLHREKPLEAGGPDPEVEDNVMLIRTRVSRIFYLRKFFDYPISLKFQTFKNMGLRRTLKAGFGFLGSSIKKRKENSLEDFYINRFGKPLYEMFFEDYTTKLWGVHPSKIAPDWGAQRVKGLSLWGVVVSALKKPFVKKDTDQKNVETSLIEQYYYPKKGPGQLWELLAKKIVEAGGEIRMRCSVMEIVAEKNHVVGVNYTDANGQAHFLSGDYVISSMPVKDLVHGMKDASDEVRHIAENLPYRDFITVGLLLNKLKIKNETQMKTVAGIVPDCWIYIQERDVKVGRLQIFNNWSPYMVEDFQNKVWVGMEYFVLVGYL